MSFGDPHIPPGDADRGFKIKESAGTHARAHKKISNLQKLHGVSVEGRRANQSLGWVKAGGGRCMQEEEEEE